LGYRRFEGLAAARAITRLYGASRLFVNFFQPLFKLASKHRDGAKVTKRYRPPLTPCDRLLQAESVPAIAKNKLREVSAALDPLKFVEEMRAVQAYLVALADGEVPPAMTDDPPNLATFVAGLSSAWHNGEIRPTFYVEAKPKHLRGLQSVEVQHPGVRPTDARKAESLRAGAKTSGKLQKKPQVVYAARGHARIQALRMAWPIMARRLEGMPNLRSQPVTSLLRHLARKLREATRHPSPND
jgi:hypothetical protein